MTCFNDYPASVKDAMPGLLRIPGKGRGCGTVARAAEEMWSQLTAKEKLAYLIALQLQCIKDAEAVNGLIAELSKEQR